MGAKKKRFSQGKYDDEALEAVARQIKKRRTFMGHLELSKIDLDKEKLEATIKRLPSKDREALENFAGLVPGTTKHYKRLSKNHSKDPAFQKQVEACYSAMQTLTTMEYLVQYDSIAKNLLDKVLTKFNRKGVEDLTDMECLKYYLAFLMFFLNGPQMIYQEPDEKINVRDECSQAFDQFALLWSNWSKLLEELPDGSVKLKLLVELFGMFDLKDIVAIKRYVGLPIKKADDTYEEMPLNNFMEVRMLKERMFPLGAWEVASYFVLEETTPQDKEDFSEFFSLLRSDWKVAEKYEVGRTYIETIAGRTELKVYQYRDFQFTDIYEAMSLYVCRNYL